MANRLFINPRVFPTDALQAGFNTVIYLEDVTLPNDLCFSEEWQRTDPTRLPEFFEYKVCNVGTAQLCTHTCAHAPTNPHTHTHTHPSTHSTSFELPPSPLSS